MTSSSSRKVIYAALLGNVLVALTKFLAAGVTGSSAMISEGVHSLGMKRTRWATVASSTSGASSSPS